MTGYVGPSTGAALDDVGNKLNNALSKSEENINTQLDKLSSKDAGEITHAEIMETQMAMQKFTMVSSMASQTNKALADAMKSVCRNVS
ncbi:MAG: hypothetical protein A2Y14_01870 [Verrucomicrobia bacterium GWF2_51_19]|nr:MAG: hypothetical protein A2Y14_01870 [Verrucomicrobia bacterium GWF2_51_19]HCJ11897.1 hypothetical protein [Opitutae bacterium]